jgi:hypothetical protein
MKTRSRVKQHSPKLIVIVNGFEKSLHLLRLQAVLRCSLDLPD